MIVFVDPDDSSRFGFRLLNFFGPRGWLAVEKPDTACGFSATSLWQVTHSS
jgi:hypothetical protein